MIGRIRQWLPKPWARALRRARRHWRDRRYYAQPTTVIRCGNFDLEAPAQHGLVGLLQQQPDRDLCVGIAARHLGAKYPDASMIDIGANIGDTAAMMASHAANPLVLVEASDFFYAFLERNAGQFPNPVTLHKALIGEGRPTRGAMHHWAGTASFIEETDGPIATTTRHLAEIAGDSVCLVKTDTDGFDFRILLSAVDWLSRVRPGVLFENQIRDADDLAAADQVVDRLANIGYTRAVVWDDAGHHLLSTESTDVLHDLNRYQFKLFAGDGAKALYNFDTLLLHERDDDVHRAIAAWARHR
jgi:FkbM family methyltransferase